LVHAIHAIAATVASTTITHAKRNLLAVMAFETGFGFAGIWICRVYLLVSELPYTVSQLPSMAVSVLMQIKRHDLHRQRMRCFTNRPLIASP